MQDTLTDEQQKLVEVHYEWARAVISKYIKGRRWPRYLYDDILSDGLLGLMRASSKYNHDKGDFKSYARFKIIGACIDGYRGDNWLPRSYYLKCKLLHEEPVRMTSLEVLFPPEFDDNGGSNLLVCPKSLNGELLYGGISPDFKDWWEQACRSAALPEMTIKIIEDVYFKGKTQRKVGKKYGVSASRVSQIIGHGFQLLRAFHD